MSLIFISAPCQKYYLSINNAKHVPVPEKIKLFHPRSGIKLADTRQAVTNAAGEVYKRC
jgi:hypothetical protein